RPLLSEFGLMHRRVQVEVEWFIALSDAGFTEFRPLTEAARGLLRGLVARFSEADAQAIKEIERTTNHDVKAVEYWLRGRFDNNAELKAAGEFVHFSCTSDAINKHTHAPADRQPDHGGQGDRQRRRASRERTRTHRVGEAARQDERRGRQLQRAP